uniref:Murine leukemia virus integrase C-terminal domain-containing protein n=1 Tax=Podarcis muralis TaxID=64176 RepID=A0A670K5J9_PODMU
MNQQLKSQLGKLCKDSDIKWVNALPLVLHNLRACPRGNLKLSPYELLFGRPSPVYNTQYPTSELEVGESELTKYVIQLQRQLILLHKYAASSQNIPLDENVHPYQPGDWILAKTYHKIPLQPTWEGPYQILLTTPTSVKVAEKTAWLHHTRCKPASVPEPAADDSPYSTPRRPPDNDSDTEDAQQTGPARGTNRAQQTGPDRGTNRAQQTGPDRGTNRAQQTGPDQPLSSTHWTSEIIPAPDHNNQPPIRLKLRKTRTAPRQRGELSISENPTNNDLLSTWHSNTYVKLISQIAKQTAASECWICANAPAHLHSGLPFLGVPLTLQQHLSADVQSWNLTAVNFTHQYIYLTGPTTGDLCRRFSGTDKVIGESTCKYTIDITLTGKVTLWYQSNPSSHPNLLSAWKRVMGLPEFWDPSPTSQCFFRTFLTGRINSCLQGLFWICGHRGYVWASPHSRGTCYLGLILPGIRVTQNLPPGRMRNKRAKDLSDLSDVEANGETYGRALFPAYGAGSNHVDILKLTDILLNFMEESNAATQSILTELTEVRQNSIQNRLALDYVLASTGGVCALVGTECCTHVSDQTLNITGHLNNIHKLKERTTLTHAYIPPS